MKNKLILFLLILFLLGTTANAQDYNALRNKLLANFPQTFNGKPIPTKTYNFGHAIINQIIEDLKKLNFDETNAKWFHVTNYILYDTNSAKKIGNTCWLVYKSSDNKIIGTYMMNMTNPVNNRILYTAYKISGGNYTIKEKIHRDLFSKVICKESNPRPIQRF